MGEHSIFRILGVECLQYRGHMEFLAPIHAVHIFHIRQYFCLPLQNTVKVTTDAVKCEVKEGSILRLHPVERYHVHVPCTGKRLHHHLHAVI